MAAPGHLQRLASYIVRSWIIFWDVLLQQLWFCKAPGRKQQLEMLTDATRNRCVEGGGGGEDDDDEGMRRGEDDDEEGMRRGEDDERRGR